MKRWKRPEPSKVLNIWQASWQKYHLRGFNLKRFFVYGFPTSLIHFDQHIIRALTVTQALLALLLKLWTPWVILFKSLLFCNASPIVILKGPASRGQKLSVPGKVPFWKKVWIFALPHLFSGPKLVCCWDERSDYLTCLVRFFEGNLHLRRQWGRFQILERGSSLQHHWDVLIRKVSSGIGVDQLTWSMVSQGQQYCLRTGLGSASHYRISLWDN